MKAWSSCWWPFSSILRLNARRITANAKKHENRDGPAVQAVDLRKICSMLFEANTIEISAEAVSEIASLRLEVFIASGIEAVVEAMMGDFGSDVEVQVSGCLAVRDFVEEAQDGGRSALGAGALNAVARTVRIFAGEHVWYGKALPEAAHPASDSELRVLVAALQALTTLPHQKRHFSSYHQTFSLGKI